MAENLKISLVIPAHNEENYIGWCLDAAIENSGGKFYEIIVVDNASTDKTKETAEKRKGVRVVYEAQKGLTRARERGFREAKGDLIAYIDADTLMPPGWFESVEKEFGKNPQLASLSGPYRYYDIPGHQQFFVRVYWYFLAMPMYFLVGYMTVGGNFVISRKVLEKMGGFDTTIEFYGEDTNIARRASKYGKVKFKPSHVINTSGRRLTNQGILNTSKEYMKNFLSEAILHKPVTKKYKDYR